jgi:hypothetical protein
MKERYYFFINKIVTQKYRITGKAGTFEKLRASCCSLRPIMNIDAKVVVFAE